MKTIEPGLAAHLKGDATTLCHCWRVTRRDGIVLGFTEHDHDLSFDGTDYRAASGFAASETEAASGLQAEASEVAGGFSSDAISEADIAAGRYDGARVEVFLVNWQEPSQRLLEKVQEIGEVTRQEGEFRAELRSFAHHLSQDQGRVYNRRCDASLGDGRCRVDLEAGGWIGRGTVEAVLDATRIRVAGLDGFAAGFFRFGRLTFIGGGNDGITADVGDHVAEDGGVTLTFWLPLAGLPEPGDALSVTAGCDKSFETCRKKFGNGLNFQGFPHMPGADFAYSYADGDTVHDGRVLFP
ncbi:DUF2163 domain-containing protein [Rhizobiaceae bacterium n13]|uniref:DUF2163 domain-containing protein n=1 Tax=Ferirhizobium litorale TaxID=2927786 RepID=UPI0024B2ED5D|nr:DUF2163 domain-containing protein [Fererhizobium litorale]MDI7861257.1 DUF2163 domain-containing protein [Fererhizobium litorale]